MGRRNKRVALIVVLLTMVVGTVPVLAQDTIDDDVDRTFTSLAPFETILENFAAGVETTNLTITSESTDPAILSQFQISVNLNTGPNFPDNDSPLEQFGFVPDSTTEIESVAEFFNPEGEFNAIPPLHPWRDTMDPDGIFKNLDGWELFDEGGPVTEPINEFEGTQIVWGIQLAQPFDTSCAAPSFVGRAWVGASISAGPDPLFTEDALNRRWPGGSHAALADEASRAIELSCSGGAPIVTADRMRSDLGIRPFGPIGTVALVKGDVVVFLTTFRQLDGDLRQQFYATPANGGPVERTVVEDDDRVLVPNVYDEYPVEITLVPIIEEDAGEAFADTATAIRAVAGSSHNLRTGTEGCPPENAELMLPGEFSRADVAAAAWGSGFFRQGSLQINPFTDTIVIIHPNGTQETYVGNRDTGTWTLTKVSADGESCEGEVEPTNNGQPLAAETPGATDSSTDTSAPEGDDGADDGISVTNDPEPATDGGSIPWAPILLAVALLGGLGVFIATRRRGGTRTRDCTPEQQAYDAAWAAYEPAKAARDQADADYAAKSARLSELNSALSHRLPAPNRELGFPDGPEGQAAYERARAEYHEQEVRAEEAEAEMASAQADFDAAEAHRNEADAAVRTAMETLEQARLALDACKGTNTPPVTLPPLTPPPTAPTPPPAPTGGCTEGATRTRTISQQSFRIVGGAISIDVPTAAWRDRFPEGRVGANRLAELDQSTLEDLFADLDNRTEREVTAYSIPTKTLTVSCEVTEVCEGGAWVQQGDVRRVESMADADPITKREFSRDATLTARLVLEAQAEVAKLRPNEDAAANYGCD